MSDFRVHQCALVIGTGLAAILLVRFAVDFSTDMSLALSAPFVLLVVVSLLVAIDNIRSLGKTTRLTVDSPSPDALKKKRSLGFMRAVLFASVPIGFLASSLDCTGLSLQGCSQFCTTVKLAWLPLVSITSTIAFFKPLDRRWLTSLTMMSFLPLVPHCVCYNVGNAFWIERIGTSPSCYVWGFVVGLIAISSLRSGNRLWRSATVCVAIIGGALVFFVAHHYLHYPW